MKILDFYERCDDKLVVVLGFFDCVHVGHLKLIERGISLAKKYDAEPAVFTFLNDPGLYFDRKQGIVLTFNERLDKLKRHGVNTVITSTFDKNFATLRADVFLGLLATNFNVKAIVCGFDYTYGLNARGNVETLATMCKKFNIELAVEDKMTFEDKKISTTLVKEYLATGDIIRANTLLVDDYAISGIVVKGRKEGKKIGFPTANIIPAAEKFKIKNGVYKTHVVVDGKVYKAITNYGPQPTFLQKDIIVESHLKDFNSRLYGKRITVIFDDFIRNIVRFSSVEELKAQLEKDMESIE